MVLSTLAGIVFMVLGGLVVLREWHIYRGGSQEDGEDALPEDAQIPTEGACAEEDEK